MMNHHNNTAIEIEEEMQRYDDHDDHDDNNDQRHHHPQQQHYDSTTTTPTRLQQQEGHTHRRNLNRQHRRRPHYISSKLHETLKTTAGIAGNILEWYDFAVFGFFSDILGLVFFPKDQSEDLSVMESFAVFGGAFLMRPIGGLVIGYIGDVQGRKVALEISIFLMAIATTLMGCLPTYQQIGGPAILLLLMVRMLQGLSVGGQLMSSLVFTLEGHPQSKWGLYGSCVMAAGNFGTFLGGIVAYGLRSNLTQEQLLNWGWRIPFLSGILISFCGIYLKYFCQEDEIIAGHHAAQPVPTNDDDDDDDEEEGDGIHREYHPNSIILPTNNGGGGGDDDQLTAATTTTVTDSTTATGTTATPTIADTRKPNPLRVAFSTENRRSLLASSLVPMLWSGGFYLSFVWMPIYMSDLVQPPIPSAFGINSCSLLLLGLWFPAAGFMSDYCFNGNRKRIMTIGGISFGIFGPISILIIGNLGKGATTQQQQNNIVWIVFCCQTTLGISLALWGAPMCAWLVEAFEPKARLTSVSIGYNVAQALAGGMSPFFATLLVDTIGVGAPGILLFVLAILSLIGLLYVAPKPPGEVNDGGGGHHHQHHHHLIQQQEVVVDESSIPDSNGGSLEMKEIC